MYVYGIFDKEGCIYIGKSNTPEKRKARHFHTKYKGRKKELEFRVLREYDESKVDWEHIYIVWNNMKRKLDNKALLRMEGNIPEYFDIKVKEYFFDRKWNENRLRNDFKYWMDIEGYEYSKGLGRNYRRYNVWKLKDKISNITEVYSGEKVRYEDMARCKERLRKEYILWK
jgi:predicted GIY-YIG superfamily endonuclease